MTGGVAEQVELEWDLNPDLRETIPSAKGAPQRQRVRHPPERIKPRSIVRSDCATELKSGSGTCRGHGMPCPYGGLAGWGTLVAL